MNNTKHIVALSDGAIATYTEATGIPLPKGTRFCAVKENGDRFWMDEYQFDYYYPTYDLKKIIIIGF